MTLSADALIDLATAKAFIGTAKHSDTMLELFIESASTAFEEFCHRKFTARDVEEIRDGDGRITIWVQTPPIITPANVVINIDEDRIFGPTTELAAGDFIVRAVDGRIILTQGAVFAREHQNIKLVYSGGYATIPATIQMLCAKMVAMMDATAGTDGFISERIGGYSYTKADLEALATGSLPPSIAAALGPWVREVAANEFSEPT